jgi:ribosome maturation factor RimP
MSDKRKMDERLAREVGVTEDVAQIAEPLLESMGYRLVRVRMAGKDLQIMAEREDGTLTIDDCVEISRALSPILDVEDPVRGSYNLEISSPGIARPLVRPEDFERWAGHVARIEMTTPIDGRKRFRGVLEGYDAETDEVRIFIPAEEAGGEKGEDEVLIGLSFGDIAEARLVMTDELMKEASRRAAKRKGLSDGAAHEPEDEPQTRPTKGKKKRRARN